MALHQKWPTPAARDYRTPNRNGRFEDQLQNAVAKFPSPVASGKLNGGTRDFELLQVLKDNGQISEEERRSMSAGNGGKLNPNWVEWLMGWPIGWTGLEPLETDRFRQWFEKHGRG